MVGSLLAQWVDGSIGLLIEGPASAAMLLLWRRQLQLLLLLLWRRRLQLLFSLLHALPPLVILVPTNEFLILLHCCKSIL